MSAPPSRQEFIRFLKKIDRTVAKHLDLHLIVDNYTTHKTKEVQAWLERHPRFKLHFIPTSSSWLNLVERLRSGAASSRASPSWRPPSMTISPKTMPRQNPSFGQKTANIILEKHQRARTVFAAAAAAGQVLELEH